MFDKEKLLAAYDAKFMGGMSLARKSAIRQFIEWLAKQENQRFYPHPTDACPAHVSSNRTCANCGINISELAP